MNPGLAELQSGFLDRLRELGQPFTLERTGEEFRGILMAVQPLDPQLSLGADWRELATLETRRDKTPAIIYGDKITQEEPYWSTPGIEIVLPTWKVIRRDDNPANFAVRFWLVKITDQDPQS